MAVCDDDFDSGKYDEDDGATSISYPMYPSELGADRGRADGHDGDDGDDDIYIMMECLSVSNEKVTTSWIVDDDEK